MPRPLRHLTGGRSRPRPQRLRADEPGAGGVDGRRWGHRPAARLAEADPAEPRAVARLAEAKGERTADVVGSGFTTGGGPIPTL